MRMNSVTAQHKLQDTFIEIKSHLVINLRNKTILRAHTRTCKVTTIAKL